MSDMTGGVQMSSVTLKRWEFYAFICEAFLLVAALAGLIGIAFHSSAPQLSPLFQLSLLLVVPVVLLPAVSVSVRRYHGADIAVGPLLTWYVVAAFAVSVVAFMLRSV